MNSAVYTIDDVALCTHKVIKSRAAHIPDICIQYSKGNSVAEKSLLLVIAYGLSDHHVFQVT